MCVPLKKGLKSFNRNNTLLFAIMKRGKNIITTNQKIIPHQEEKSEESDLEYEMEEILE